MTCPIVPAPTRRHALGFVTAVALMPATVAYAGGDGGQSTGLAPSRPALKDKYTQREFSRLSSNEINEIWIRQSQQKKNTSIVGFSDNMATYIIEMAYLKRRWTSRMIRDMRALTKPRDRKLRLAREIERVETEITKLQASLARAKKAKQKNVVSETEAQIFYAQTYLDHIRVWAKHLQEGAR